MKYHKIDSVFKRDPDNHFKSLLVGEYANPAFEYLADAKWSATEKIDGTNTRIHVADEGFTVGGRSDNAQLHVDLVRCLNEIGSRAVAAPLGGLTLFGEGYGAGIQKGGLYREDKGFILFDVMVTATGTFLERDNVEDISSQLGVPVVGVMATTTLNDAVAFFSGGHRVDSAVRQTEAEGWVLRPLTELRDRLGGRVITKLKVAHFPERSE